MKSLLIIDDEQDIVESLKVGLERHGFRVEARSDPVDAVANFRAATFDLVLLDIRMPRMNGFEVFRRLTEIDKNVRICFLTAFDLYQEEFNKIFPSMNAQCFIRKPISIVELAAKVNATLKR